MPFIHNEVLNPCKCGSKEKPDFDSDDMVPSWIVQCYVCGQQCHDSDFSYQGAIKEWNKNNPPKTQKSLIS